jgi:hypothetical protein
VLLAFCPDAPSELVDLLRRTDGIRGDCGSPVVWSCVQIVGENRSMRSHPDYPALYWSFDQFLFVGADVDSDHFGYRVLPAYEGPDDIYRWDHENDSRMWFANSLSDYLARFP